MTFNRLWAFLAIGLPVLAAVIAPFPSVDLTYHLRAGGDILDTRVLPAVDTYTFTVAGQPWLDQQWLAQVVLAAGYRLGGWTGLVLERAVLVGIAFGLLFDLCRRRSGSTRVGAWLSLAAFICAAVTLGLRPQLFGVTLFVAVLWLVVRRDEVRPATWLVPVLVATWGNLHGSFILGPVLVGIALVEDVLTRSPSWTRTATLLVASILATLVNPFGIGVWTYAAGISTNSVITKRITEWQPTSVLSAEGALFFISVALVALLLLIHRKAGLRAVWRPILWLAPFAILGASAVRGLAWWPFVAATTVAILVRPAAAEQDVDRREPALLRRANAAIATVLIAVAVIALPIWRPLDHGLQAPVLVVGAAPSGITGALRQLLKPGDRIFAPQPWGSWLEFAFPQATVAVDSRIELYPNAVWDAVDAVETGAADWKSALRAWHVRFVIAGPTQATLVDRLASAGWQVDHHDEDGTLLEVSD